MTGYLYLISFILDVREDVHGVTFQPWKQVLFQWIHLWIIWPLHPLVAVILRMTLDSTTIHRKYSSWSPVLLSLFLVSQVSWLFIVPDHTDYTLQAGPFSIPSQSTSRHLSVKSVHYEKCLQQIIEACHLTCQLGTLTELRHLEFDHVKYAGMFYMRRCFLVLTSVNAPSWHVKWQACIICCWVLFIMFWFHTEMSTCWLAGDREWYCL